MKLIFINRFFYPDRSATSQMLSDLAFELAEQGRTVHVITGRGRDGDNEGRRRRKEVINGVVVHRVWASSLGSKGLVGRAIEYGTFQLSAACRLWRTLASRDVVVAKTDPPLVSVVAASIARLRGARLVNWLQDVFPEVAEAEGVFGTLGARLFKLLRRIRNWSLRSADVNVVLGDRMAEHLRAEGVEESRIRVIANWQDGQLVQPVAHSVNPLRERWGLGLKFVVGYSGNLGRVHEVSTILEAMERLQDQRDSLPGGRSDCGNGVSWLFVGGGVQYAVLEHEVADRGLVDCTIKPHQPREHLSQSLSAADVHLVTLRPEFEGLVVPSKFYGVAAAGRPTLYVGDQDGEIARLITKHACGRIVRPGDGEGLARYIVELARDRGLCEAMGRRARAVFEEHFESNVAIGKWNELLSKW